MEIQYEEISAIGRKFYIEQDGKEVARAYLYILSNDLHEKSFGFMEDVFVDEALHGQGFGSGLVSRVINEAKKETAINLFAQADMKSQKYMNYMNLLASKITEKNFVSIFRSFIFRVPNIL